MYLNTNGSGLWSDAKKKVKINRIQLGEVVSESYTFGELCVVFDRKTWNVHKDGLIYTDKQFLRELREYLTSQGLPGRDVEYSEQGMQGNDYVSFDVQRGFLEAWARRFKLTLPSPDLESKIMNSQIKFRNLAKAKK